MNVESHTAHGLWQGLLQHLLHHGQVVSPRGERCYEVRGLQLRLADQYQNIIVNPGRGLNYRFMVAEWLWILLGRDDLALLAKYNSQMTRYSDEGLTLAGAYGPRLQPQWLYIIDTLRRDPYSRQAVASIWRPPQFHSRDVSCTLSLQFLLRPGLGGALRLHTVVTMRSSDAWLGIPYDIFNFTMLSNHLVAWLNLVFVDWDSVTLGEIILNLGSAHLYERDVAGAHQVLEKFLTVGETVGSPQLRTTKPSELSSVIGKIMTNPSSLGDLLKGENYSVEWVRYLDCLRADTSAQALEVLRALDA